MFKAEGAKSTAIRSLTLGIPKVKSVPATNIWGLHYILSSQMTKTFRDKCDINMKQYTSCELLFPDVRTQWKMYSFVPSEGLCMQYNHWCDFRKAYIPWLRAAYNFGCRALYNLPWRASVCSYQVQRNIPTFEALLKQMCTCFLNDAKSPTMYGCALWCSQIVYTSISPHSLNITTAFYFVTECPDVTVLVWGCVQATNHSYFTRT